MQCLISLFILFLLFFFSLSCFPLINSVDFVFSFSFFSWRLLLSYCLPFPHEFSPFFFFQLFPFIVFFISLISPSSYFLFLLSVLCFSHLSFLVLYFPSFSSFSSLHLFPSSPPPFMISYLSSFFLFIVLSFPSYHLLFCYLFAFFIPPLYLII